MQPFFSSLIRLFKQRFSSLQPERVTPRRTFDFAQKSVQEIFIEIYEKGYWRTAETVSGNGSDLGETETLRRELPGLLQKFGIKTLLDLPCGDFNWMRHTDLSGIQYIGADIVPEMIAANNQKFSAPNINFRKLDLITDPLPLVDCILVRDCLVHLSLDQIEQAIKNLKRSGSQFLLTTSFPEVAKNDDIQTGYWRTLNLEIEPFGFPEPLAVLFENCTEEGGTDKSLMLWRL